MSTERHHATSNEGRIIFEPASWLIKIDFIHQFVFNNNVLISILGDTGSGKSTFAQLLEDKLDRAIRPIRLTTQTIYVRETYIEELSTSLDLPGLTSIQEIVNSVNESQLKTLLIIDNAEQLPESFLKECLDALKQQEGAGCFHICLLSDFSLVKLTSKLARESFRDLIHSIELQPLSEDETKEYVLARLEPAIIQQADLSDEAFHDFYQLTEGNIASINTQSLDFFKQKQGKKSFLPKHILSYSYIPVIAAVAMGTLYFMYTQLGINSAQPDIFAGTNMQAVEVELPLASEIPYYQLASSHQPMEMLSLQKAELQVADASPDDSDSNTPPVKEDLVVMDKVVTIPDVKLMNTEATHAKKAPIVKPTLKHAASVLSQKKSPAKPAPSTPHVAHTQPAANYTIQLLASRDKAELNRIAKRYASNVGVKVRRFNQNGVTWYVLTHGEFSQKQLAKNALTTLPQDLAKFKPWVRSTMSLDKIG
jgi:type II secretory pathway predicted ATPase ExeA